MANLGIEERVTNEAKDLMLKGLSIAASISTEVANVVLASLLKQLELLKEKDQLKYKEGQVTLEEMQKAVKLGEKMKNVVVSDQDFKAMSDLMKKQGVMFAATDMAQDDGKMVFFLDRDTQKMENCVTVLQATRGMVKEVNPELFVSSVADENIGIINAIDPAQLELFRYYAQEEDLVYSVFENTDNVYQLLFNNKDREKIENMLHKVAWDLTGNKGEMVRTQAEKKVNSRLELEKALNDSKHEYYIVNGNNPKNYLKVTKNGFEYYKNNNLVVEESRDSALFMNKLYDKVDGLMNPVVLSKKEFALNDEIKMSLIRQKQMLFPENYEPIYEDSKRKNLANLVDNHIDEYYKINEKMYNRSVKESLDDEGNTRDWIYDDSIDYSSFAGFEIIMDDEELNARRIEFEHYKESLQYSDKFQISEVYAKERNLDYLIQQSAAIRDKTVSKESREKETEKEHFKDGKNDR